MQRYMILTVPLIALGLIVMAGCGGDDVPDNYKTTITITYKGAPVEGATVTLRSDGHDAPSATGVTGADGSIDMFTYKGKGKGVVPGAYIVSVEKVNVAEVVFLDPGDPGYGEDPTPDTYAERDDVLPSQYVSAATSGLTCTVTDDASANVWTFDLED